MQTKFNQVSELDVGFTDTRRLKKSDYKGTLDGTSAIFTQRTHSLSASAEASPSRLEFLTIGYDGFENKVLKKTFTEEDLRCMLQKKAKWSQSFCNG